MPTTRPFRRCPTTVPFGFSLVSGSTVFSTLNPTMAWLNSSSIILSSSRLLGLCAPKSLKRGGGGALPVLLGLSPLGCLSFRRKGRLAPPGRGAPGLGGRLVAPPPVFRGAGEPGVAATGATVPSGGVVAGGVGAASA